MKIVRGYAKAKEILSRASSLDMEDAPPQVQAKIREVFGESLTPAQVVGRILEKVWLEGDSALLELTRQLEGIELKALEVTPQEIAAATKKVPPALIEALTLASYRIKEFHEASLPRTWMSFQKGYGELVIPMHRVGLYIPGGTAAYPSSVLMTAIPARVAGVREVILATPARNGVAIDPAVLAAANIAGVDRVFRIGGAQAIAAMAYGTATVPKVDIVCGPGNIFVTLAKKLLAGNVGVDGIYGPTETLVIADETAYPSLCAADLLAQAEHDIMAMPIIITTSERLAKEVKTEVEKQLLTLERGKIARFSIEKRGHILIVDTLEEAIELANYFAPEHLCIMVKEPWGYLSQVKNAGGVFIGEFSPEVMGDYVAGPSHVMPTGGTARFASPMGVHTFLKRTALVALGPETFRELSKAASLLGRAEGFTGHAKAVEIRTQLLDSSKGGTL